MWAVRFHTPGPHAAYIVPLPEWAAETDAEAIAYARGYCAGKGIEVYHEGAEVERRPTDPRRDFRAETMKRVLGSLLPPEPK